MKQVLTSLADESTRFLAISGHVQLSVEVRAARRGPRLAVRPHLARLRGGGVVHPVELRATERAVVWHRVRAAAVDARATQADPARLTFVAA